MSKSKKELFNPKQSTHTQSIHESIGQAACLLKKTYEKYLTIEQVENYLFDIKDHVLELPHQKKNIIIKSSVFRLCSPVSQMIEPISKLSIQQLLVLVWLAIHDQSKRLCPLSDGLHAFHEALYEIQREYNFDEVGVDLDGKDQPACLGGAFNKLIERLQGIYPGIEIIYISKYIVTQKLKIICLEEIERYISQKKSQFNIAEFRDLIFELCNKGLDLIWSEISQPIRKRFFEEFGCLFNNNPYHNDLEDIISLSKDINIDWQQYLNKNCIKCHIE